MSDELKHLVGQAARGKISRREFVGRAGALGVSATMAGSLLATAARAEGPVKGGMLRVGMQGGSSTDSLDPALAASEVPFQVNETWGEKLVDVELNGKLGLRVAEEVSSNADATQWMFKIRKGVEYHDGGTVTAEDVVATLKRHTDENAKSGAQGIVKGISEMKAEGDMVTLTLSQIYRDGYKNCAVPLCTANAVARPQYNPRVKSYTVYNMTAGVRIQDDLNLTFGVRNILNQDPPFAITYDSNTGAGSSWEPRIADPRGRSFTVAVETHF